MWHGNCHTLGAANAKDYSLVSLTNLENNDMLNLNDLTTAAEVATDELNEVEGGYFYYVNGVLLTSGKTATKSDYLKSGGTFVNPIDAIINAPRYWMG